MLINVLCRRRNIFDTRRDGESEINPFYLLQVAVDGVSDFIARHYRIQRWCSGGEHVQIHMRPGHKAGDAADAVACSGPAVSAP